MTEYKSSDIATLKGLEPVRAHPGMYGFNVHSQQGQFQLFKEVLDNAVDEATISPNRHHEINITFIKLRKSYQVVIQDSGRGVPLDKLVDVFSKLHTSGKWSAAYSASIGTFGVGVKATAALSNIFCAVSKRRDGIGVVTFNKGIIRHTEVERKANHDRSSYGTTVVFEPDSSILEGTDKFFDEGNAYSMAMELQEFLSVFIKNITFRIWLGKTKIPNKVFNSKPEEVYQALQSIKADLVYESQLGMEPSTYLLKKAGISSPIIWKSDILQKDLVPGDTTDVMGYYIEFFLTKDFGKRSGAILSAVNMTKITNKSAAQIVGLHNVLKNFISPFIEESDQKEFFMSSYKLPFNAVIMAKYQGATFIGQDKNNFTDRTFLRMYVEHLTKTLKTYPSDYWKTIYSIIADDIEDKWHKYMNRDLKLGSGLKNMVLELNNTSAYVGCRSTDSSVTELFITEGNSAGDFVRQLRNTNNQAVFKLRGKPLNPFRCDTRRLNANEVYQDLKQVLGTSANDRELENLNFSRIIILTDADSDGYHIAALLIGILYKINPMILETGKVMMSNPPLYVVQTRASTLFVLDKKGLMDTKVMTYEEVLEIKVSSDSGGYYTLNGPSFRDMCYMISHIGKVFSHVANKLVISEEILEMMVHVIDYIKPDHVDTDAIAKKLNLDNCILHKMSNSLILNTGGIEITVSLNNLVQEIKAYILPLLEEMNWAHIDLFVTTKHSPAYNNTPVTVTQLYQIFQTVDKFFQISRMKGLGEMNGAQLTETCIDPQTRTFTTVRSIGNVEEIYNMLGVDTGKRKQLIETDIRTIQK